MEDIIEDKDLSGREITRVIGGEGYGIVEDCDGPDGLEQIAEAFQKRTGDEYEQFREWLGIAVNLRGACQNEHKSGSIIIQLAN